MKQAKVIYNLSLVALYSVIAIHVSDYLGLQMLFSQERTTSLVAYVTGLSLALLSVHYFMILYGEKNNYLSAISVVLLAIFDLFVFGVFFLLINIILLLNGPFHLAKSIFSLDSFSLLYWIDAIYLFLRISSSVVFFKTRNNNKTGDGLREPF